MNKIILFFTQKLMAWCERHGRTFNITGNAGPDDVYLRRYYVVKSKYFNFFIHQFFRSDRDDMHDHPWDFCTFLVRGAYTENRWNQEKGLSEETRRTAYWNPRIGMYSSINRLVFRRATDQHQVVVDRDLKFGEAEHAALTLCFTGPTKREWGFVRTYEFIGETSDGRSVYRPCRKWVPWREYLGLPPETPGRG